jgi:predicted RNase H-like HicB family nuclease
MIRPQIEGGTMIFNLECEMEEDGRLIAEVPELPGVLAYGGTKDEAMAKAEVLALRVLADRLEHLEDSPQDIRISIPA